MYLETRNSSTVFIIYYDLEGVTQKPFDPKSRVVTGSGITAPGSQAMRSGSAFFFFFFFFFFQGYLGSGCTIFVFMLLETRIRTLGPPGTKMGSAMKIHLLPTWKRGILGRTSRK